MDVVEVVEQRIRAGLAELVPELVDVDPAVRTSQFADLQADLALRLGRQLGRPPREVAQEIVELADLGSLGTPEVAGPGFINLDLSNAFLAEHLTSVTGERLGVPAAAPRRRVVVDYSAPNVAKEMHVGHLRSTIIGDALARVLEFLGHEVVRHNHLGDWGTPFGMLIEHLIDVGEGGAVEQLSLGDLGSFYRAARADFEADPAFADRARQRVVDLQAGEPETRRRWQLLVDASTRYFMEVYDHLDVTLTADDFMPESAYNDLLPDVTQQLVDLGVLTTSDGALCAFPAGFARRDDQPLPLIVRKRDGGYGYAATDLAAVRERTQRLDADWIIYVVGAPQAQHLEMVFAVARDAGWLTDDVRVDHVGFGSVLGEDGKALKSRAGQGIRLIDLLEEAQSRAEATVTERGVDLDGDERDALVRAIGIGAVKYADLANDRVKDYVFDWDRMLSLSGNTAPYLQYAHTRPCSLLERAGCDVDASFDDTPVVLNEPAEHELALRLLGFHPAVTATAEQLQPHRLCTYLYELAGAFNRFYETCPVLTAETPVRESRLRLTSLTRRTLATGLDLLGIRAPRRM